MPIKKSKKSRKVTPKNLKISISLDTLRKIIERSEKENCDEAEDEPLVVFDIETTKKLEPYSKQDKVLKATLYFTPEPEPIGLIDFVVYEISD